MYLISSAEDWYKPNINTNARFVCGDPHVDPRQWSLLVAYWDSEKGQVDLEQRINAFKNTAENNDAEMTNKVIDEMFVAVFGPEKHNNVRGYGIGVVPNDMPHLVREKRGLGMELQTLKVAYKEQAVEFAKKTQEQREELVLTKLALDRF